MKSFPLWLWAAVLSFSPEARGQEGGGGSTKENLDLPFDAAGGTEGEDEQAPELIVFYGQQYEGDFFCFTCDKSRSMEGDPWRKLQKEVVRNITQFSERVEFAIVFFDGNQVKFPKNGRPASATPPMKAAAVAMVTSTNVGPWSCYKEALVASLIFANQATAKKKVIILLGDGQTYCNGMDKSQYGQQTLKEVKTRNVQKVQINTLGIGDVDESWMKALASQNSGSYRKIQ